MHFLDVDENILAAGPFLPLSLELVVSRPRLMMIPGRAVL
jgi:hypothetical protein